MVRIVEDFWTNYHEYENVIMASILHIARTQFPNKEPQGESDTINFVITELYRMNTFGKWQVKRLTDTKKSTRKQFENYLYQRIWSILWNEYGRRRKRSMRFKRMPDIGALNATCYSTPDHLYEDEPKIDEIQNNQKKNGETAQEREARLRHKRAGEQPTIHDAGEITGRYSLTSTDEDLQHKETLSIIYDACTSDKERKIVELREQGLQMNEVGETLGMSGSNVGAILARIRGRLEFA